MSDNPVRALARLRGESITVDPAVTEIGRGVEREQRELTLQLTNNTDRPIYVFGGTKAGYCNATVDLPLTILGGDSRSIRVRVMFRGEVGLFQHLFVLYTDDQQQPIVTASFSGRVISGQ